jgi:hypothetical protein
VVWLCGARQRGLSSWACSLLGSFGIRRPCVAVLRARGLTAMSPGRRIGWPEKTLGFVSTRALAIGVQSNTSWPCGQDFRPKSECHQRRYLRHEAGGVG